MWECMGWRRPGGGVEREESGEEGGGGEGELEESEEDGGGKREKGVGVVS